MTSELLTTIRELDSRFVDGLQVRLLWSGSIGRLWVSVVDTRTREAFRLEVRPGEKPQDVFRHPFAYAAQHRVELSPAEPGLASLAAA